MLPGAPTPYRGVRTQFWKLCAASLLVDLSGLHRTSHYEAQGRGEFLKRTSILFLHFAFLKPAAIRLRRWSWSTHCAGSPNTPSEKLFSSVNLSHVLLFRTRCIGRNRGPADFTGDRRSRF